jgi:hypothetical protein
MWRMKVDVYPSARSDLLILVPEGVDPNTVELPDEIAEVAVKPVCRSAELGAGRILPAVEAWYAVLEIVATGFSVSRVCPAVALDPSPLATSV